MGFISRLFQKIRPPKKLEDDKDVEALRVDFKERYHNFKLLLNSNNKALEIMADIEEALHGKRPFGMTFIRASCTSVSVNVFRMIRKIDLLAPGKYSELFNRFNLIQQAIEEVLRHKKIEKDPRLVIPLKDISKELADVVGSKMANLGEMRNKIHINVPPGFAITTTAYDRLIEYNDLRAEIDRKFQAVEEDAIEKLYSLSADIQQMIIRAKVPDDLSEAILNAYKELEKETMPGVRVALRSSALGEDAAGSSFAGQYRSELNVSPEHILQSYKEVAASKYTLQAITYRLNKGFRDEDVSMSVGCIAMVDAVSGGVIYTHDPVNPNDQSIFINSAWGLPKTVVDGSAPCDLFVVSRNQPMTLIRQEIRQKDTKFVCFPQEGVCRMDLTGDLSSQPSLNLDQVMQLAEYAVILENYYGCALDIEWAITESGSIYILQCRPLKAFNPSAAENLITPKSNHQDTVILSGGITASPGCAAGPVYIVKKAVDILQFPKDAVLVAEQALPRWASLLNRSAAVITEQGGFAGHLANVAREFNVPAIFGIQGALEKLKTGDMVTVDANSRMVHKGRIDELLVKAESKPSLMHGSPVYDILKQVSDYIIPLNLLDPDSLEFNPSNCKTFHDITRFIHEKSVIEMFNFGKEHNFSERSSKQLYYNVPMQWWILNLDDGFKEEVTGKYVKLENIACVPMLALWDGMVAVPWEGPPIDGKGLMSVMFQATTNRSLTTGTRSQYAEKNYFMISKNFCNLSSRLGFHFSTLEALITDRAGENYITFQFKGGAADYQRRIQRVNFIKEILEEYGFKVDIKEDSLMSRIENYPKEVMIQKMKILGYLTIHTRQLDMIMSNPNAVNYYRNKLHSDIKKHFLCS